MPGLFSPIVWADGDDPDNIPDADDLNSEWTTSFNFLLGYTRPMALFVNTTGTAVTSTEVNVPFNNETLKRGGMVHSTVTNNHQLTVPLTGQYQGFMIGGFATISAVNTRCWVRINKNGVNQAAANIRAENLAGWNVGGSFVVDATAGDIITMTMNVSTGSTAVMNTSLLAAPKLGIWYVGDYQ